VFRIASLTKPDHGRCRVDAVGTGKIAAHGPGVALTLPELGDVKVGLEEADASTGPPAFKPSNPCTGP